MQHEMLLVRPEAEDFKGIVSTNHYYYCGLYFPIVDREASVIDGWSDSQP